MESWHQWKRLSAASMLFVVLDISVTDQAAYARYVEAAPETIGRHGGRYLVRGGAVETISRDWAPERFVVVEFPSRDQYEAWYNSPEYQAILPIRTSATNSRVIVVEGYVSP